MEGIHPSSGGDFQFNTNNVGIGTFFISATLGNIGIGTLNPGQALDVGGTLRLENTPYLVRPLEL